MAGKLHNDVYDDGLQQVTDNANVLHILSADPGVITYGNIATYTLGNKATPTVGAPEDHTSGRVVNYEKDSGSTGNRGPFVIGMLKSV